MSDIWPSGPKAGRLTLSFVACWWAVTPSCVLARGQSMGHTTNPFPGSGSTRSNRGKAVAFPGRASSSEAPWSLGPGAGRWVTTRTPRVRISLVSAMSLPSPWPSNVGRPTHHQPLRCTNFLARSLTHAGGRIALPLLVVSADHTTWTFSNGVVWKRPAEACAGRATITMTGPANVWFGTGFDARSMADAYAIIIDGNGTVRWQPILSHMPPSSRRTEAMGPEASSVPEHSASLFGTSFQPSSPPLSGYGAPAGQRCRNCR